MGGDNAYPGESWQSGDPIPEGGVEVVNGQLVKPAQPKKETLGDKINDLLHSLTQ